MVGYLMGTGKLTPERVKLVTQVLHGEHDDLLNKDPNAADAHVAATQPATTEPSAQTHVTLAAQPQELALADAVIERRLRDLQAQRELLDHAVQETIDRQEAFEARQKAEEQERAARASADQNAGFKRELEYLQALPPAQAKDYVVQVWRKQPADAVRIFTALPVNKGSRILEALKTPEEQKIREGLLEQLRLQDRDPNAP
jgi:hypothetical protein